MTWVTDQLIGSMVQAIVGEIDPEQVILELTECAPCVVEFRFVGADSSSEAIDRNRPLGVVQRWMEQVQGRLEEVEEA